jgi:hypothetical protein
MAPTGNTGSCHNFIPSPHHQIGNCVDVVEGFAGITNDFLFKAMMLVPGHESDNELKQL